MAESPFSRESLLVDYVFGLIYERIAPPAESRLLAATDSSAFVLFINSLTAPLSGLFMAVVPSPWSDDVKFELFYRLGRLVMRLTIMVRS